MPDSRQCRPFSPLSALNRTFVALVYFQDSRLAHESAIVAPLLLLLVRRVLAVTETSLANEVGEGGGGEWGLRLEGYSSRKRMLSFPHPSSPSSLSSPDPPFLAGKTGQTGGYSAYLYLHARRARGLWRGKRPSSSTARAEQTGLDRRRGDWIEIVHTHTHVLRRGRVERQGRSRQPRRTDED